MERTVVTVVLQIERLRSNCLSPFRWRIDYPFSNITVAVVVTVAVAAAIVVAAAAVAVELGTQKAGLRPRAGSPEMVAGSVGSSPQLCCHVPRLFLDPKLCRNKLPLVQSET